MKTFLLLFVGFLLGIYAENWRLTSSIAEISKKEIKHLSNNIKDAAIDELKKREIEKR